MKEFYKMSLGVYEDGLSVSTQIFVCIHETPCYYLCLPKHSMGFVSESMRKPGESMYQCAKRGQRRIRKIHKTSSRVAFDTREKAFENLMMLKKRQIFHAKRTIEANELFLSKCNGFDCAKKDSSISNQYGEWYKVNGTADFVKQHYIFD